MVRKICLHFGMLKIGAAWLKEKNVLLKEHRDIVCATATGKFPGKKGNKLNPKNALICCSPQWGQKCWEGKGLQEYALILYQI